MSYLTCPSNGCKYIQYLMGHILARIYNQLIDKIFRPLYNMLVFFPRLFTSRKKHPRDQALPPALHDNIDQSPRELSQHEDGPPAVGESDGEDGRHGLYPQIRGDAPRSNVNEPPLISPEDQLLLESHSNTVARLANLKGIKAGDLDEMAHSYAQLAILSSKYGNEDYKKCIRSACSIYDAAPGQYFEEKITMLNNVALNLQSLNRHSQSVQLYEEVISLADQYLPINDHRTIVIKNNLGCALIASGDIKKGQEMLRVCLQAAKGIDPNEGLTGLLDNNMRFYGVSGEGEQVNLVSEICS